MARALVSGRGTRLVVAVVSDSPDVLCWYLARVVTAGAQVLTPQGLGVGVVPVPRERPAGVLDALARDRTVGGLVLVNTTHEVLAEVPRGLVGRTVSIGVGSATVPAVDVDAAAAARRRVEHLVRSVGGAEPAELTTTHPVEDIATAAVRAALDGVRDEERFFPSELVVRASA